MIRHAVRPFPEAAIVEALDVIVLERTDEPMAGDNPMGRDVRTALTKALQHERGLPAITPGQMPRLPSRMPATLHPNSPAARTTPVTTPFSQAHTRRRR